MQEQDLWPRGEGGGEGRGGEGGGNQTDRKDNATRSLPRDFFSEKQTNEASESTCVHAAALPYGYTCALRGEDEEGEEVYIFASDSLLSSVLSSAILRRAFIVPSIK